MRRELRHAPPDVPIRDVAARRGFWHIGRFAQYYRETFGELPSYTVRAGCTRSSLR